MPAVIPLSEWYPAMHEKWQDRLADLASQGVKTVYELEEREAWVHHHSVGGADTDPIDYARIVADIHWDRWLRPGGYNFMVVTDSRILEMCGWLGRGAHSGTHYWNKHGLGLCFQGDYRTVAPATVMVDAARSLITALPIAQTTHRVVRPTPTTCPGAEIIALLPLDPLEEDPMLPIAIGDDRPEVVRSLKQLLNETYDARLSVSSPEYDAATVAAVKEHLGPYTGNSAGQRGEWVGGVQWARMLGDLAAKNAGSAGVTEARVKQLIASARIRVP